VWENPIYTFEVCKFDDIATSLTKLVSGPNSLRAMILLRLDGGWRVFTTSSLALERKLFACLPWAE
jgi:hypothetical protein